MADWAEEFDAQQAQRLGALSRFEALERIGKYPPEWRVDGILSTDDYGVLAGPKGVGKTFALVDLAVSVALGRPWFGRFPTQSARVLLMTSEDSEARLWRRADAIARSFGVDPEELEDRLYIHPWAFSAITDLDRLRYELRAVKPGLAVLDPAYRYLSGAAAQLFDMGAVLTPLQEACATEGAPLIVGHHYNRKNGARREERISGAGLLEWARLVITAEAPARRAEDSDVVVTFEITGNSIDPRVFKVRRRVEALDDSPNPELRYSAEVTSEDAVHLPRVEVQRLGDPLDLAGRRVQRDHRVEVIVGRQARPLLLRRAGGGHTVQRRLGCRVVVARRDVHGLPRGIDGRGAAPHRTARPPGQTRGSGVDPGE